MKVIFLDFDGVLNSKNYINNNSEYGVLIDDTRMTLLKQIINATDAKIVLSTSWREHWDIDARKCDETGLEINKIFNNAGLSIIDKTPQLHNERDKEIEQWLSEHHNVTNFVILDDMPFEFGLFRGHFVLTSNVRNGLDVDDVKKAIRILADV